MTLIRSRAKVDVGYHTHGKVDFTLDEEGIPIAWKPTRTGLWLSKFYAEHIDLDDFGELGGPVGLWGF